MERSGTIPRRDEKSERRVAGGAVYLFKIKLMKEVRYKREGN